MKKNLLMVALIMVLVLVLAGCGCKHEWQAATCDGPKTCALCGDTEGQALEHNWKNATCDAPKTCSLCGKTEGDALTHDWQEATTDAPKTCSLCGKTEGEKITVDSRFTTASTKFLHGIWTSEVHMTAEDMGLDAGFAEGLDMVMTLTFTNDGEMTVKMGLKDEAAFKSAYKAFIAQMMYEEFQGMNMTKAQADQAMMQTYGMTVEGYAEYIVNSIDMNAMFQSVNMQECYYVKDGGIYCGMTWAATFERSEYTLTNGILEIAELTGTDGQAMKWTKAQ